MLPRRLIDHSKRLLLLVGLSTTAAVLPRPTVARSSSSTGTGAGSGSGRAPGVGSHASCASGFATATPAGTSNAAAAKHSYSPRAHLYERPPEHLRLKQVVVIARHGDRVPIARTVGKVIEDSPEQQAMWQAKLPPTEEIAAWRARYPPLDSDMVPLDQDEFPYSQLTVRGAQELRALGEHLRRRYVGQLGFLPDSLGEPKEQPPPPQPIVYARATNIRRTQQSAQNLLLGLYPEGSLPIEVRPTIDENLYPNPDRKCRRQEEIITELRKKHYDLPEDEVVKYKALLKDSKERLGLESFVPWNQVREVLTCFVVHGIPLPPPVDHEYVERVVAFTSKMWGQWFRHPEFARLGIGPFIGELLEAVDARVQDESPHQLLLYAGHDSTIVPLLAALDIYKDIWPPYSSHILLELAQHKDKPEAHYVRVLYNDKEKLGWRPYDELKGQLHALVPVDYEAECQCRTPNIKEAELAVKEDGVGSTIIAKAADEDKDKDKKKK